MPAQIRGQVWFHVPYLGAIRDTLHGGAGMTLLVTLVLAAYALLQIGGGLLEQLRSRRADAARDDGEFSEPAREVVDVPA